MIKQNLNKRLQVIEKEIMKKYTPSQEELVCAYFCSITDFYNNECSEEEVSQKYELVKKHVPILHGLSV